MSDSGKVPAGTPRDAARRAGDRLPGAGQGRLAPVIATRGGLAAPEAPFVIEHREALIYMLCEPPSRSSSRPAKG